MPNFSFISPFRLKDPTQFKVNFERGERIVTACYVAYYLSNSLTHSRLGLVASKRSVPLAVVRNRTKRLTREAFRHCQHNLKSLDIVIIVRKKAYTAGRQELHQCLRKLFERLQNV